MMSKELILEWVNGLPDDAEVGIDDGGLCIRTQSGDDWLEIGGIPEEGYDHELDAIKDCERNLA